MDEARAATYEMLRHMAALRTSLEQMEYLSVQTLRAQGVTWEEIGEELGGISRQAARDRFAKQRRRYST